MNIIKKSVGIALLIAVIVLSNTASAQASVFNWTGNADSANSQSWSFDSLYQSIQSFVSGSQNSDQAAQPNISSITVASTTNPSSNTGKATVTVKKLTVLATAYSSTPDQTDDSPFITADGSYVHDGIIAANFLPFGTVIKIPEIYGDKIFVVEDRMNQRYSDRIDIWFPSRDLAKQFGAQKVTIEIVS